MRLQKRIEKIEEDISVKMSKFPPKTVEMEERRLKILNDPNLTEEQKGKMLAHQKLSEGSVLTSLQSKKEKFKDEARIEAQLLQSLLHDLEQEHLSVVEELEKTKVGVSPSEILKILDHYAISRKYFFDDKGRFYFNEDGVRIYIGDSHTSEYMMRTDKTIIQIQADMKKPRAKLRDDLIELLRLHKLIEQIDKEICEKTPKFQSKTVKKEQKPLKIAKNTKLTEKQKRKIHINLDQQLTELKQVRACALQNHKLVDQIKKGVCDKSSGFQSKPGEMEQKRLKMARDLNLTEEQKRNMMKESKGVNTGLIVLQKKKEKLKDAARFQAQILQLALQDLKQQNLSVVKELEKTNIGVSPSEILKILEQSATSRKYFFDNQGRFHFNKDGVRIYKRDSHAAEYMIGSDGILIQVSESADICSEY